MAEKQSDRIAFDLDKKPEPEEKTEDQKAREMKILEHLSDADEVNKGSPLGEEDEEDEIVDVKEVAPPDVDSDMKVSDMGPVAAIPPVDVSEEGGVVLALEQSFMAVTMEYQRMQVVFDQIGLAPESIHDDLLLLKEIFENQVMSSNANFNNQLATILLSVGNL